MLEFKVTGKTINQAIQNGIEKLGVNKENVEIKVLTPPQNFKDAEVLICVPKVFATPELEDLYAVQNIDSQIAKTQKSVQKRRKEKNEILKKLITEVVFEENAENLKPLEVAQKQLGYILKLCGAQGVEVVAWEDEEHLNLHAKHPNLDAMIGVKGKTLAEIQKFLNEQLKKQKITKRAVLDFNGFKENEIKKLEELTQKLIKEVLESRQEKSLKPMNAFQRRVVHNEVAKYEGVESESSGTPPKRFVTIKVKSEK